MVHANDRSRKRLIQRYVINKRNVYIYFYLLYFFPFRSIRTPSTNNTTVCCQIETHFAKGSLIELANGEFKLIEDMRAEDFITSSNSNPNLQLADSTVLKFKNSSDKRVMITFVYNNSKVSVSEHEFLYYILSFNFIT